MDFNIMSYLSGPMQTMALVIVAINAILHLIFAGAVAKDAGQFSKVGGKTYLVSGITWAFATLVGGVFVAVVYWVLHHVNFARLQS
ncbi:MAG: hypothetical protein CMF50_04590 [Legionellales bacterium]|nr:hypothetical protein [Legionellales bacterium]|tara:strand:+ start:347 stop:604 length:258 start_codon:yes stop_codon:yes gene_type:complete